MFSIIKTIDENASLLIQHSGVREFFLLIGISKKKGAIIIIIIISAVISAVRSCDTVKFLVFRAPV